MLNIEETGCTKCASRNGVDSIRVTYKSHTPKASVRALRRLATPFTTTADTFTLQD